MKTFTLTPQAALESREWFLIDAEGQTVGRVATRIASVLRGKHKPTFTPHVDSGDFVVVINADKVVFTGNKTAQKTYYRHSGYPGGLKEITAEKLLEKRPEDVLGYAVKGMLPKTPLGRSMFSKAKIYSGADHPHAAQKPKTLEV